MYNLNRKQYNKLLEKYQDVMKIKYMFSVMHTIHKFFNKNNKKVYIKIFILKQETQISDQKPQMFLSIFVNSFKRKKYNNFIEQKHGYKIKEVIGI